MIVRCQNCNTGFTVDDGKVENKKFAFNCLKCGTNNIIDNRISGQQTAYNGAMTGDSSKDAFADDNLPGMDKGVNSHLDERPGKSDSDIDLSGIDDSFADESLPDMQSPDIDSGLDFTGLEDLPSEEPQSKMGASKKKAVPDISGLEDSGMDDSLPDMQPEEDTALDFSGLEDNASEEIMPDMTSDDEPGMILDEIPDADSEEALPGMMPDDKLDTAYDIPGEDSSSKDDIDFEGLDLSDLGNGSSGLQDAEASDTDEQIDIDLEGMDIPLEVTEGIEDMPESSNGQESLDDMAGIEALEELQDIDDILKQDAKASQSGQDLDGFSTDSMDEFSPIEDEYSQGPTNIGKKSPHDEIKSDEIFSQDLSEDDMDESITIDLDSLDIQLTEEEGISEGVTGETDLAADLGEMEFQSASPAVKTMDLAEEDENITIDLDSLDLPLAEDDEIKTGESLDENERLTLDDAGITLDELVTEQALQEELDRHGEEIEEDLKLTIDEIDPSLSVDKFVEEQPVPAAVSDDDDILQTYEEPAAEPSLMEQFNEEELPEIDIEKFEKQEIEPAAAMSAAIMSGEKKDFLELEDKDDYKKYLREIESDEGLSHTDVVPKGAVNFSIDYSLNYTRLGAILRLIGIYPFRLLSHFIVLLLYSMVSAIIGPLNWLLILFTGNPNEDFYGIQEKTIRYLISLNSCAYDVVEDTPRYAGKKDIDYSIQYDIIYPINPSRLLAFLRLSVVGILLISLPHLLILLLISLGSLLIYFAGLISIIATKKWPNILFDFMIRYFRYTANVYSFILGLVDRYPTFRFE